MITTPIDLFVFDLDGTVTREELLPRIASAFGLSDAIIEMTRQTIAGDIPFESSLRERVRILGQILVAEVAKVAAAVELDPGILEFLERNADRCVIITGNLDVWIGELARRLPVPILCSRALVAGDKVIDVVEVMEKGAATRGFGARRICAVGEGHNDLAMFEFADVAIAYGGVHAPARSLYGAATHFAFESSSLCRLISRL